MGWEYLSADVADEGDVHTVRLSGELDIISSRDLTELLDAVAHSTVVVDLARLAFIDAAGIGALIEARQIIRARGDDLVIANVPDKIRRVLAIAEATHLL